MNNKLTEIFFRVIRLLVILCFGIIIGWFSHDWQQTQLTQAVVSYRDPEFVQDLTDVPDDDDVRRVEISAVNNDQLQLLNALLKQHKFEAVMILFESLQQDSAFFQLNEANDAIFIFARELMSNKDYKSTKTLLDHYLFSFNRDITARLLLVEVYIRLMNYQAAIDELYLAKGQAFRPGVLDTINKKIHLLVNKQAGILKQNIKYHDLLVLYEKLTQQEADYAPYFIGLADAQIMLGDFDAAKSSLQMVLEDPDAGFRASTMLAELQQKQSSLSSGPLAESEGMEEESVPGVALYKRGSHYLLDAYPNGGEALRLLIDTGASLTVLTPAALNRHNVQFKDTGETRRFNTANGIVEAPVYQLDYLIIGEWTVDNIAIAVLDLQDDNSAEGLLGMNFLQHFRFFMDQKNKRLRLSLRK